MRTRPMLRTVSLGVVVVATLLALVAPAAGIPAVGSTAKPLYVAGVETFLGVGVPEIDPNYHAGVRFRGTFFPTETSYNTWWLSGKGTVLVVVDYLGVPWTAPAPLTTGFVRTWIPVNGGYAFRTSSITGGTVTWPVDTSLATDPICNAKRAATVDVFMDGYFTRFHGCLADCAIITPIGQGCPIPPKIWGTLFTAGGGALQASDAPPTEAELEPEFQIEQNRLFLPLIQAPGD